MSVKVTAATAEERRAISQRKGGGCCGEGGALGSGRSGLSLGDNPGQVGLLAWGGFVTLVRRFFEAP
jgi:hypothetical protein